jgi:NADH:ubiquinone oxidoreductase subunit 6 (subunit J)
MAEVFFFLAAIGAVAGAIGTVTLRNPFYSVLALVCHLIALAALFLLLRAEFVAAAQVIVYAGAVMVLYVFVVAYVGGMEPTLGGGTGRGLKFVSGFFAFALFVELSIALIGTGLAGLTGDGAPYKTPFGEPAEVGRLFLTTYLVAFEIASILLLIAAVGAVILARRRAGLAAPSEIAVSDLFKRDELTAGQ